MRLLLVIGPPAVGKMTVGRELAALGGFRLFHNHHTIEPLVEIFGYGTPAFRTLDVEFRCRIIQEAAHHDVDLIFTLVWNLDDPDDLAYVEALVAPVIESGGSIATLELAADLTTRLLRNQGADRLAAKPTKRDLAWSAGNVRQMEQHRMNTDPAGTDAASADPAGTDPASPHPASTAADPFLTRYPHLRLETAGLTAAQTAGIALGWLEEISAGQSPTPY